MFGVSLWTADPEYDEPNQRQTCCLLFITRIDYLDLHPVSVPWGCGRGTRMEPRRFASVARIKGKGRRGGFQEHPTKINSLLPLSLLVLQTHSLARPLETLTSYRCRRKRPIGPSPSRWRVPAVLLGSRFLRRTCRVLPLPPSRDRLLDPMEVSSPTGSSPSGIKRQRFQVWLIYFLESLRLSSSVVLMTSRMRRRLPKMRYYDEFNREKARILGFFSASFKICDGVSFLMSTYPI